MWKYPHPTAYRVLLIEAGCISQNISLAASDHQLSTTPTAALNDSAAHTLLQLDCAGQQARLTLRAGAKQVRLAILDANNVVIKNADAGKVEFNCGPQKPRTVLIEFEPQVDSDMGTAGAIKSIEFK